MLWGIDEVVLFFGALAAFLIVLEVGFRIGRHRKGSDETAKTHFNAIQSALLSLLALLLGFNFAMAASRFETRKSLIQEEVDAINTTYLRAQLLPESQREGVTNLLRGYVDTLIEFLRAGTDDALLEKANVAAAGIMYQLWQLTSFMMSQDASGASKALFVQSLNEMINVNEKRRAALDNHVPELVIHLLFTVAVVAMGFIAYGYGLTGRRRHGSTAIFAVMIALVLTTILDLDQPRSGLIRIVEESILRLKATLDQNRL
jgi:hypothetical protein